MRHLGPQLDKVLGGLFLFFPLIWSECASLGEVEVQRFKITPSRGRGKSVVVLSTTQNKGAQILRYDKVVQKKGFSVFG